MTADTGPNTTQIVVVLATMVATITTSITTLIVTLRGRGRAVAAHDDLGAAIVHTYNATAAVADKVGAGDTVEPLEAPK
jgi:hypothetical protein